MTPFEQATKETLAVLAPPTELTVSEWADKYRFLSPESSAEPGPWDTSRAPYQRGMMDAFSDPEVSEIVNMTSSQIGKNEIMNNMIGYVIHKDPAPILFISPIDTIAKTISRDRIAPMIRDTPVLAPLVSNPLSRDGDNAVLHKTFPGGHLTLAGANSPSNLASRPIKYLFLDEEDRYPLSAGDEGSPSSLAGKRTVTFWNAKQVKSSTPGNEDTSQIEPAFKLSNQQHYYVPCPKCKKKQILEWAYVKWDKDPELTGQERHMLETIHIECKFCKAHMEDIDLMEMLEGGEWRKHNPDSKIAGFHINELYSPWVKLERTVYLFLVATYKRDRQLLKVWTNTSLGESFKESGDSADNDTLENRAEDYGDTEIPDQVLILTAAIDVQDDRLEMEVIGWNENLESWGIEYNVINGDPNSKQVWEDAREWVKAPRLRTSGLEMVVASCAVDSGGHHTQEVYRFCRKYEAQRFWAIKGRGGQGVPFVSRPTTNNNLKCKLFTLGVDEEKANLLLSNLKLEAAGPNYCHFPKGRGYDGEWFKQLVAEERKIKYVQGIAYYYWAMRTGYRRNEALDIRIYNKAALEILNVKWIALKKNLLERENVQNGEQKSTELLEKVTRPKPKRGGFVKNF